MKLPQAFLAAGLPWLLGLSIWLGLPMDAHAQDPPLQPFPSVSSVMPGETFTVNIQIGSILLHASDVFGIGAKLHYDPDQLAATTSNIGTFLDNGDVLTFENIDNETGTIALSVARKNGAAGADGFGVVVAVEFTVREWATAGTTPLTLSDVFTIDTNGDTIPLDVKTDDILITAVTLDAGLWLEGAYSGGGMSTNLTSLLPQSDPYGLGKSVASADFFTNDTNGQQVVDWVRLQLRTGDPMNPPMAIVAETAGLLRADGSVVSLNAVNTPSFAAAAGAYYLVVQHRNHLAAMSAVPVSCTSSSCTFDFRSAGSQAFGSSGTKSLGGGAFALYAGDGNASAGITASDQTLWQNENGFNGYLLGDYNLSAGNTASDQTLWLQNNGLNSQVPPAQ